MDWVSFAYRPRWMNCLLIQRFSARLCGGLSQRISQEHWSWKCSGDPPWLVFWRNPVRISAELLANTWRIFSALALFTCRYVGNILEITHSHILPNYYLLIIKKGHLSPIHRTSRVSGFGFWARILAILASIYGVAQSLQNPFWESALKRPGTFPSTSFIFITAGIVQSV
jgi:hypothetical protein